MTERTCSVPGCDRPHKARRVCHSHYMQWYNAHQRGQAHAVLDPLALRALPGPYVGVCCCDGGPALGNGECTRCRRPRVDSMAPAVRQAAMQRWPNAHTTAGARAAS